MATTTARYSDCLPAARLAERLGVDPARIEAMRRDGELIAVRDSDSMEWLYPAWQFERWQPRRGIPRIVSAAREARLPERRLYELLTAPLGIRGDRRLADLLVEGRDEEVVRAIREG
jgi:hypothetical protein